MVLRDFRCVSARAAYRGVKNVDLRPLFLLWREEGFFYITSVSEKKPFSACRKNVFFARDTKLMSMKCDSTECELVYKL